MILNKDRTEVKLFLFSIAIGMLRIDNKWIYFPKTEKLEPYIAVVADFKGCFNCSTLITQVCWYNYKSKRSKFDFEEKDGKSFFLCGRPIMEENQFLPGLMIPFLIISIRRVLLEHDWYEQSIMLKWNNQTFLKSWEKVDNTTEVSMVSFS